MSEKAKAIHNLTIFLTFDGVFPRSDIYEEGATNSEKREFKDDLAYCLMDFRRKILKEKKGKNYTEKDHYRMIEEFGSEILKKHKRILQGGKLRIGIKQKMLNLFWKVNWLLHTDIKEPLHCPFDSIIIQKLKIKGKRINWTEFDSMSDYKKLVKAAEIVHKEKYSSIAEWELGEYLKKSAVIAEYRNE